MAQTQTGEVTAIAPLSGTTALTFTPTAALNITTQSWRTLGRLYRELDLTKPGLEYALQKWLPYRTDPPGVVIDFRHRKAQAGRQVARRRHLCPAAG